MAKRVPVRVRVRMYQVGFGDCFLLSFEYAKPFADDEGVKRDVRHVLVDFGSTHGPKERRKGGAKRVTMAQVAEAIEADTAGRLDVLVATHRHADHVSAFGRDATATTIGGLRPGLIVQPWTEHPDAESDALFPFTHDDRRFLDALGLGRSFAEEVATALKGASSNSNAARLRSLAELQFTNEAAVNQLWAWADGNGRYLFAGESSGIEDVVPGVEVTVLGPPTVNQWAAVAKQREDDEEYWNLYRGLLSGGSMASLVSAALGAVEDGEDDADAAVAAMAKVESICAPGPVRWLIERMRGHGTHSLERLVHSLDNAMNNTSLVLLFEVGGKNGRRLLFPGDAQIENWGYALDLASKNRTLRRKLAAVDLYKVGHHGSRNATPKSLYAMWNEPAVQDLAFVALMSTRVNVHGDTPVTSVPSASLVDALNTRTALHSTQDLSDGEVCLEVEAEVKGDAPFERVGT